MSFAPVLESWPRDRIADLIHRTRSRDVDTALARAERSIKDLAALLSLQARPRFEAMAVEANRLTRRHFGRVVGLYAPLYLSNICTSDCAYCGFSIRSGRRLKRLTLSSEEICRECEALSARGFQHILMVTGEAPQVVTPDYLEEAVTIARKYFPSVSVEVQALSGERYRRLCERGIEGVTLYMETYDRPTYARVHRRGAKLDFRDRLDAIERAGRAGARRINIGALLGLHPWRIEGFRLALHARYLQKECWQSAFSISFPRLRYVPEGFTIPYPVGDADLVHLMLALRLFLPEAGFTLSTRERPEFRDHVITLGVTLLSAGSSTRPGGYTCTGVETLEQFEVEDQRPPDQVAAAIRRAGYDPVWKDFDRAFDG